MRGAPTGDDRDPTSQVCEEGPYVCCRGGNKRIELPRKGGPMSPLVAIDARAAVRRETGGVERVAREMAARLPALRPERYVVLRPRPRLAHRAGHAWEQLALPLIARRAALIYCPANLAPVASRRNVVVIHDLAGLAHPDWYGRAYGAWQPLVLPRL